MPSSALPPLEWLRAFESAGRLSSFTAAGNEIGLTQAAISQRITALEGHLKTQLFKRKHRGVELTLEGDAYLPIITQALAELRRGTSDLFSQHRRHIRLVAPASIANLWVAPRLAAISRSHPQLDISLASIHREVDYDSAQYDWQIRFGIGNWQTRNASRLYQEVLAPVCTPALLATAPDGDWRNLPRLSLKGPRTGWSSWARKSNINLSGIATLKFDSFITALNAAIADAGMLLASLPLCQTMIDDAKLVQLETATYAMNEGIWMIPGSNQPLTAIDNMLVAALSN